MLFRPRLIRCWSTAGQSPLIESARTRFKISHRRTDGGVLVSNNTLEPRRDCDVAIEASSPGLGGRSDGLRLEGLETGIPFGIGTVKRKLQRLKLVTKRFLPSVPQQPPFLGRVIISNDSPLSIALFLKGNIQLRILWLK